MQCQQCTSDSLEFITYLSIDLPKLIPLFIIIIFTKITTTTSRMLPTITTTFRYYYYRHHHHHHHHHHRSPIWIIIKCRQSAILQYLKLDTTQYQLIYSGLFFSFWFLIESTRLTRNSLRK